jgi:hypothetical protein
VWVVLKTTKFAVVRPLLPAVASASSLSEFVLELLKRQSDEIWGRETNKQIEKNVRDDA